MGRYPIDDSAIEFLANGNGKKFSGRSSLVPFLQGTGVTQEYASYGFLFQIERIPKALLGNSIISLNMTLESPDTRATPSAKVVMTPTLVRCICGEVFYFLSDNIIMVPLGEFCKNDFLKFSNLLATESSSTCLRFESVSGKQRFVAGD